MTGKDSSTCTCEICSSDLWASSFQICFSCTPISTIKVYWNFCRKLIWKSKYHPPKRLDKINGQIFVKMFNITCLSTIQPGFISPSFIHLNKIYLQLEQLIWPVDTESFAPWKWFGLPKVWAAVMSCLTPQTEHIESLGQLSPRCFRQIQKLQCPFFKATSEQLRRFNFLLLCYLSN